MLDKIDISAREMVTLAGNLFAAQKFDQAGRLYQAAANVEPDNFDAVHGAGCSLAIVKKYAEALPWIDRASNIAFRKLMMASLAKAVALGEMGRTDEAFGMINGMLAHDPGNAMLHYNRAVLLTQLFRFSEALDEYDAVIKLDPTLNADVGSPAYSRGFIHMMLGNYADGLRDLEDRPKLPLPPHLSGEQWTGTQDLDGKTIVVLWERGLGDNIMFARYLPVITARWDARVVFFIPPGLPEALAAMPGVEVVTEDAGLKAVRADYWVRIMSLAYCLRTTKATIPPPVPLAHDDELLAKWRWFRGMGSQPHGDDPFRVGLCWAGALKKRHPRLRFYGLQQDIREGDRDAAAVLDIEHIGEQFGNFRDTAHAMKCLDLVITCDTSIAHMAGTVGVPTWVLLTTFRTPWVYGETKSAWYPSMTCFRQDTDGDWPGVVARLTGELETLMSR